MKTELLVGLVKANQAGKHFLGPRKNIAHIFKNREPDTVIDIRDLHVGENAFQDY